MMEIIIGTTHEITEVVLPEMSANRFGSGLLEVYSTPAMIALMEKTSFQCLGQFLHSYESSVGGEVNVRHLKATAIGETVRCRAVIAQASGKRVVFEVEVYENDALIGKGTHTRFVIDADAFMKTLKLNK